MNFSWDRDTMGKKVWEVFEKFLYVCLVRIFHMSFLERRWSDFMQFIKFGLVGVSNTLISYIIYLIGLGIGLYYLFSSVLGFIISVINSFYWNNRYVFKTEEGEYRNLWKSFCKTFLAYAGTGLFLNNILLYFQVDMLAFSETIAPLINLLITIPLNFILNKLWAFKKG